MTLEDRVHALRPRLFRRAEELGNLVEPFSSKAVFSRYPLAVGGYKIGARVQEDVRAIVAPAVPGAMLAPLQYSAVIPLFTAELPQIAVQGYMLRHTAIANGEPELAESRMRAIGFVTRADNPQAANDLVELLAREELTNVVVSRRAASSPLLKRLLASRASDPSCSGPASRSSCGTPDRLGPTGWSRKAHPQPFDPSHFRLRNPYR